MIDSDEPEAGLSAAADALEEVLVEHGPMSIEELTSAFVAADPSAARELLGAQSDEQLEHQVTNIVRFGDAFWRMTDGRIAAVRHALRRATFTHRVTAMELQRQALDLMPDLVALAMPQTVSLADETELRVCTASRDARADELGSVLGPDGWLAGYAPGQLLAVGFDGQLARVEAIDEDRIDPAAGVALAQRLRDAVDAARSAIDADGVPEVHRVVVDTMGADPSSFAEIVAPLTELFDAAALLRREAWVGPAQQEWSTPAELARLRRLQELLKGADSCCVGAARHALGAWHRWLAQDPAPAGAAEDPTDIERTVSAVAHGTTAGLLGEVARLGRPGVSTRQLGRWAASLRRDDAELHPALAYLQALGADAAGDAVAAEALLLEAVATTDHPACLGLLAEFAAERGDAARSVAFMRRAGRTPSEQQLSVLQPFLAERSVGRNEACPCGSGRKYKACCAGGSIKRSLLERAEWLLFRAQNYAMRTDDRATQTFRQLFDPEGQNPAAIGTVADMVLFGAGGLTRYLAARGPLLAQDELACATSWLDENVRLLEIGAEGDRGVVTAVDRTTGDELRVVSEPGFLAGEDLVLARALPVGSDYLLSGWIWPVSEAAAQRATELVAEAVTPTRLWTFQWGVQLDAMTAALPGEAT